MGFHVIFLPYQTRNIQRQVARLCMLSSWKRWQLEIRGLEVFIAARALMTTPQVHAILTLRASTAFLSWNRMWFVIALRRSEGEATTPKIWL
jgi:hypothetical protein